MLVSKNKDTKIKAGEYEFSPSMTPKEILAKLLSGLIAGEKVVVKEGESIYTIGKSWRMPGS